MNSIVWENKTLPRSAIFDDTYYSRENGRAETDHVFIKGNQLPERWQSMQQCTIGELGFGTGLNFLETVRQWKTIRPPSSELEFVSFEQYPLAPLQIEKALSAWPELSKHAGRLLDIWEPGGNGIECRFEPHIRLVVSIGDANTKLPKLALQADAWYLDGFAPSRNPELWYEYLLSEVFRCTKSGGSFATYTAAGFVRRNLEQAGFRVQKAPGFGSKREMLTGIRQ